MRWLLAKISLHALVCLCGNLLFQPPMPTVTQFVIADLLQEAFIDTVSKQIRAELEILNQSIH